MLDDVWPLSLEQKRKIDASTHTLLTYLDVEQDLVGEIARAQCLTREQRIIIANTTDRNERIRKLLSIMSRRSIGHFKKFIECIRKTQKHLVSLLVETPGKTEVVHITRFRSLFSSICLVLRVLLQFFSER